MESHGETLDFGNSRKIRFQWEKKEKRIENKPQNNLVLFAKTRGASFAQEGERPSALPLLGQLGGAPSRAPPGNQQAESCWAVQLKDS